MKFSRFGYLIILIMAAALWSLAGCESESVAPHDSPPALEESDVAHQAGYTGMAFATMGPYIFEDLMAGKDEYTYVFPEGGDGDGTVYFEFFNGLTPSTYQLADNGTMETAEGESISLNFDIEEKNLISLVLTFDLVADPYSYDDETATLNGSGTMDFGAYDGDWVVEDVMVDADGDPASGTLTFTIEDMEAIVNFDDNGSVTVTIGGEVYTLDLDTGVIT